VFLTQECQPFRLHASDLDILPVGLLPMGASVPDDLIVDCVVGPAAVWDGGSSSAQEEVSLFPKFDRCIEDMSALLLFECVLFFLLMCSLPLTNVFSSYY
jgi:hypothetical protein